MRRDRYDTVIVGGGHNGLVAAAYLARAGQTVLVLERRDRFGGAAVSGRPFPGLDVRVSRYSYLVSLLPDRIRRDLGLRLELRRRPVASYTPVVRAGQARGLLVEADPGTATRSSFRDLTGGDADGAAWARFYGALSEVARVVAPTMLEPLPRPDTLRARLPRTLGDEWPDALWDALVTRPLGTLIEDTFTDDTVRGVVLTDALIGTFSHAHDPSLVQNRCFLYHVIGNGTGEWRVPVGGMGRVTSALAEAAASAGAHLRAEAEVVAVDADDEGAEVTYRDGDAEQRVAARHVLSGVAPAVLDRLRGRTPAEVPQGAQVKLNLLLTRLPRLRSGLDPRLAFAGTFHLDEGYAELHRAYHDARAGRLPRPLPAESYCHSLTDPSILGPELAARGWHTLTVFGLQTPAALFRDDPERVRGEVVRQCLAAFDAQLAEPIVDCVAQDADGQPCVEVKTPFDLDAELAMPGGHIFHGDLAWPWAADPQQAGTWGVETDVASLLTCGSAARRGGGVSGIGGHNAAHAVLASGRC